MYDLVMGIIQVDIYDIGVSRVFVNLLVSFVWGYI